MDYNQIKNVMISLGLRHHEISEGTNFTFVNGNKRRIILERLRPLEQGGARGFLYVALLEEYKDCCSKNGHINVKNISSEQDLIVLVKRIIAALEVT